MSLAQDIVITQGRHEVSGSAQTRMVTLLGSCVACCLWDPQARIGGMNHMLLADTVCDHERSKLARINAMELLINEILKSGGARNRLQAKVFGGADMLGRGTRIGARNATFALHFLAREGIDCVSKSVGGTRARQIVFVPFTGTVKQKFVQGSGQIERPVIQSGNGVDLF